MASALGSLDPSICTKLKEALSLLGGRENADILSQVLVEHKILTEAELTAMVSKEIIRVIHLFIIWHN